MNQNYLKSILITGASSGIGKELALVYASKGFNLALIGRRKERLEQVCNECKNINPDVKALPIICDVNDYSQLKEAVNKTILEFSRIDVVVANAGFIVMGNFEDLGVEDYRNQFETNVFAVLNTIYLTLEELKKTKGKLCIIGSINSYYSRPGFSAYCMSKFPLKALNDSIHYELKSYGISTTLICPGAVTSEIYNRDNLGNFDSSIKSPQGRWYQVDANKAAKQIVQAVDKGKKEKIITNHGKVLVFVQRHFPFLLNSLMKILFSKVKYN